MVSHTGFVWGDDFPPVWINAQESSVRKHSSYNVAKSGDPDAAFHLVSGGYGKQQHTSKNGAENSQCRSRNCR